MTNGWNYHTTRTARQWGEQIASNQLDHERQYRRKLLIHRLLAWTGNTLGVAGSFSGAISLKSATDAASTTPARILALAIFEFVCISVLSITNFTLGQFEYETQAQRHLEAANQFAKLSSRVASQLAQPAAERESFAEFESRVRERVAKYREHAPLLSRSIDDQTLARRSVVNERVMLSSSSSEAIPPPVSPDANSQLELSSLRALQSQIDLLERARN